MPKISAAERRDSKKKKLRERMITNKGSIYLILYLIGKKAKEKK